MDGKPITEYFNKEKIKQSEIELVLKSVGIGADKIMLLTIDDSGSTYVIEKDDKQ